MACDDEVMPFQERIEAVTDEADLEEVYNTERHLLYVACTRARDHLVIPISPPGDRSLAACLTDVLPARDALIGGTVIDDQFVYDTAALPPLADAAPPRVLRLDGDSAPGLAARAAWLAQRSRGRAAGP